jgi:hypothetical protein
MATARMVKSLSTLRDQINKLAPKRSKLSDGWLGDKAHSMRKSDHNPEPDGTVDAFDLTHDPKNGVDIQKVADAIVASKDKRVSYLICNGRIVSGAGGKSPWVWRKYTGANQHNKHLHISVKDVGQDDTTPWKIDAAFGKVSPKPAPKKPPVVKPAGVDKDVIIGIQKRLSDLGYNPGGADGLLGPLTRGAILSFKNDNKLTPNDAIDDALIKALAVAKPRVMVPERANASPKEVTEKVPEANAHWWNKLISAITVAATAVLGISDAITPAQGYITPLREAFSDVPGYVWFGLVGVVAVAIYVVARRGERKSVEAFQNGDRR